MTIEDRYLDLKDKSYKPSQHSNKLIITERNVNVQYKKSYGGMSSYFQGIMQGKDAVLRYTSCSNKDGHDEPKIIRYQVPRGDCPECYGKTEWEILPGETQFYVETKSTAVDLAGITFMNDLPVTVAWIKAVLPGHVELDTLAAGMVKTDDYNKIIKGVELRPVFRKEPKATASDVMWVKKGTPQKEFPEGYIQSKYYTV